MAVSHRSTALKFVALLVLSLLLSACGDAEPDATDTAPTEGAEPATGIDAGLLRVEDLPAGWDLVPQGTDDESVTAEESGFCKNPIPDTESAADMAVADFSKGELTTRLVQTLTSYESAEEATRAFDQVEQVVRTCREWDVVVEGTHSRFRLSELTVPNLADETLGARVDGDLSINTEDSKPGSTIPATVVSENVIVRHEEIIIVLNHFALGFGQPATFDSAATEPIARRAVEKVMQLSE